MAIVAYPHTTMWPQTTRQAQQEGNNRRHPRINSQWRCHHCGITTTLFASLHFGRGAFSHCLHLLSNSGQTFDTILQSHGIMTGAPVNIQQNHSRSIATYTPMLLESNSCKLCDSYRLCKGFQTTVLLPILTA